VRESGPSVSVIIPALDEEASIGAVIDAIPPGVVDEIVVVDGGSRDATVAVATARGARVLSEPLRGYGRACARGVSAARGDVVVFLDADGAGNPEDIRALVAPIANGSSDLVLGSRLGSGRSGPVCPAAMPFYQRLGNRLAALLIRVRHGAHLSDLSPFRAIRRSTLLELPIENLTFGWPTEMIVRAAAAGLRIVEVPVSWRPRSGGRSKVGGTLSGTMLATGHILRAILGSPRHAGQTAADGSGTGRPARRTVAIVIMAKQPLPGRTKTRLCPPLTADQAAELSAALLADTVGLVSSVPGIEVAVAVSPAAAVDEMRRLLRGHARILAVEGRTIGECLSDAIGRLFSEGIARVVALNADSPTLPAAYLGRAAELLGSNDVVLGPADDGGYYLIGLSRPQPGLFEGIAWSTNQVASQTCARAAELGLTVALLPLWYDVDTPAELERLREELATRPQAMASRTRAFLARH
jgi:rSAM/selenodomain-associated transferase 1